jgi:hypothetical protein
MAVRWMVNIDLLVLSRFLSHGCENRQQRRQEAAVKAIVNAACYERGCRERKKREKTGHVNHEPGSEFFKTILARS